MLQQQYHLAPEEHEIHELASPAQLRYYLKSIPVTPLQSPFHRLSKRAFDIVFSLLVLSLVIWFFPLLMLLVRLSSEGPLFFIQYRTGLNGRSFRCLKFRTMRLNSEAHFKQATDNDDRITQVGRFLRNYNLDELPQFFNVLAGDMSVVGPRPHMELQTTIFGRKINNYHERLKVKPGVTGLAQSKGAHGPTPELVDMVRRVRYDLFYIENWSLWLDCRIVLRTIRNTLIKTPKRKHRPRLRPQLLAGQPLADCQS